VREVLGRWVKGEHHDLYRVTLWGDFYKTSRHYYLVKRARRCW
jgi:hypothetical protein